MTAAGLVLLLLRTGSAVTRGPSSSSWSSSFRFLLLLLLLLPTTFRVFSMGFSCCCWSAAACRFGTVDGEGVGFDDDDTAAAAAAAALVLILCVVGRSGRRCGNWRVSKRKLGGCVPPLSRHLSFPSRPCLSTIAHPNTRFLSFTLSFSFSSFLVSILAECCRLSIDRSLSFKLAGLF